MNKRHLAAAAVTWAVLAAACGGGATSQTGPDATTGAAATATTLSKIDTSNPRQALAAAIARSSEVTSGRLEGSFQMIGVEDLPGDGTVEMTFSGAFDNETGAFSFSMDLSSLLAAAPSDEIPPGFADLFGEMEVLTVGDTTYMKFPFLTQMLGADTEWVSFPADANAAAAGGFGGVTPSNPADLLSAFGGLDADIEDLGRETVRGVETTHYRILVDGATLLAQADPEQRAELEQLGALPGAQLPIDFWIGDDGLVRRFVMDLDAASLEVDQGQGFERMVVTFELFDLGEPVNLVPPPADQVTDGSALEGLFDLGGLGG